MTTRSKLRGEDGAAAVEFALVVSLLFVLLFGIMEFGLAFFELQNLRSATREGARAAAIGGNSDEISAAIVQGSSGSLPDGFTGYQLDPTTGCTDATKGDEVKVTLPYDQLPANVASTFEINIPFIPAFTLSPDLRGSFRCE
jgi:Flp pilus assembly protein TadG